MRKLNLMLLSSALMMDHHGVSAFLPVTPTGRIAFDSRRPAFGSSDKLSQRRSRLFAENKSNNDEEEKDASNKDADKQPNRKLNKDETKEAIGKAAARLLGKDDKPPEEEEGKGLLNMLDPFKAGRKVRKTIGSAISTLSSKGLSDERRSIYYLDDRFTDQGGPGGGAIFSERNPLFDRMSGDSYVPEVLVVGATGEVGRLVVRRLLLDGRFRVRVLVRDLYSKTLNMLGTGVTYCQGDLSKMESLEYAVTDVDKIVFCAGAPRLDEANFQDRFQAFVVENLEDGIQKDNDEEKIDLAKNDVSMSDRDWLELESVMELRSKLAEQVDYIGMKNLVRAYQNVRVADYGTSQAAKRSLFKFGSREEDFNLFAIDGEDFEDDDQGSSEPVVGSTSTEGSSSGSSNDDIEDAFEDYNHKDDDYYAAMADQYDDMNDPYADYENEAASTRQAGASTKTLCKWVRNEFGSGVFVGKVPAGTAGGGGEAAIVSSRLRSSREDPEAGIDLSNGFGGFICKVCADGGNYEAFIRTGAYQSDGIEYVCEFSTFMKPFSRGNKSKNKFMTLRLDFANFKPVRTRGGGDQVAPPFRGQDVRQIGFRYRSVSNPNKKKEQSEEGKELKRFYFALRYIKIYRSQPEPEFIYLSDARIPPVVESRMVRHKAKRLLPNDSSSDDDGTYQILDDAELKRIAQDRKDRSSEETYYKYRGEEILKSSGLSYTIIRVGGYNELPTADSNTIELQSSNNVVTPVSRADVAQVCAHALLDPNALNKSCYISRKKKTSSSDQDLPAKFKNLPTDQ